MLEALWEIGDLVKAAGGEADAGASSKAGALTGISIDTRTLSPGELFVALKDQRDGHEFVPAAFAKGAAAALVCKEYERQSGDGMLIRVADVQSALESIAVASRARLSNKARVIAVTGSAGKTTTKEMLRTALESVAPGHVHASVKSFNNHWGVPLTLARMPADTRFAVFEIGMSHAGEITPLTRMVRPDIALVTTVEAAHLAAFSSVEKIAHAKAEIFQGLAPGGIAVLNRDNPYYRVLRDAASAKPGVDVVSFGSGPVPEGDAEGSVTLTAATPVGDEGATNIRARFNGVQHAPNNDVSFAIGVSGQHMVLNALGVAVVLRAAGVEVETALPALSGVGPPVGRGTREAIPIGDGSLLLIDESYNANPASMVAALRAMSSLPRLRHPRRIAVLGDMLELGNEAVRLHAELAEVVLSADIDLVFAAGPNMRHLYSQLPQARQGSWAETSNGLEAALKDALAAGDAVMIKGSNGSRMAPLVDLVRGLGTRAA